jgi:hypothetical protein
LRPEEEVRGLCGGTQAGSFSGSGLLRRVGFGASRGSFISARLRGGSMSRRGFRPSGMGMFLMVRFSGGTMSWKVRFAIGRLI